MNTAALRRLDIAARILMSILFLYSGVGKLMDPASVATRLTDFGFPVPMLMAYLVTAFELVAPIVLIAGYQVMILSVLLAGYTVLTALMFHQFWAAAPAQQAGQSINFLKNLAIAGGFWFVARTELEFRLSAGRPVLDPLRSAQ